MQVWWLQLLTPHCRAEICPEDGSSVFSPHTQKVAMHSDGDVLTDCGDHSTTGYTYIKSAPRTPLREERTQGVVPAS